MTWAVPYLAASASSPSMAAGEALPASIRGAQPRKVTEGIGSKVAVPALCPPGTFAACDQGTPGHRRQADPARRAACGPSTGAAWERLLEEIRQEAQEHWTLQKPSSPRG